MLLISFIVIDCSVLHFRINSELWITKQSFWKIIINVRDLKLLAKFSSQLQKILHNLCLQFVLGAVFYKFYILRERKK